MDEPETLETRTGAATPSGISMDTGEYVVWWSLPRQGGGTDTPPEQPWQVLRMPLGAGTRWALTVLLALDVAAGGWLLAALRGAVPGDGQVFGAATLGGRPDLALALAVAGGLGLAVAAAITAGFTRASAVELGIVVVAAASAGVAVAGPLLLAVLGLFLLAVPVALVVALVGAGTDH